LTRLRLVIFDCDGVLIDSEPVANRVTAEMLAEIGWPMSAEESERRFLGMSFPDMRRVVESHLHRAIQRCWANEIASRVADAMEREAVLVPGAKAALLAMADLGLDWRVASNSGHRELAAKFGQTGITGLVAGRVLSAEDLEAEGRRGKPAPDLFLRAARSADADPDSCLVIEDSMLGARAAARAGMRCLGLCRRGDCEALAAEGATLFRSMCELPALLRLAVSRP
jgi:beta-phosphoglucomutase-like phosphatase (HAD superfamily)